MNWGEVFAKTMQAAGLIGNIWAYFYGFHCHKAIQKMREDLYLDHGLTGDKNPVQSYWNGGYMHLFLIYLLTISLVV